MDICIYILSKLLWYLQEMSVPLDILKELNLLKLRECENKFRILDLARLFGLQLQNTTPLGYR